MKRILALCMMISLLVLGSVQAGMAKETGVHTLEQAVKAARALAEKAAPEGTPPMDAAGLNKLAREVTVTVLDLDITAKKNGYLEARQKTLELKAEKADKDFKIGHIDAGTRDEIKKAVAQNSFDRNYTVMQQENCEKSYRKLTGVELASDFQYDGAYLITDAGKLKLPAGAAEGSDRKLLQVLDTFSKLGEKISAYIAAAGTLEKVQTDFKTGKALQDDIDAAAERREQAWMETMEAKADYARLLIDLDCDLYGYISRDVKKQTNPIFVPAQQ